MDRHYWIIKRKPAKDFYSAMVYKNWDRIRHTDWMKCALLRQWLLEMNLRYGTAYTESFRESI